MIPGKIVVPRINVNDTEVAVVRWFVEPWQKVRTGDQICEVETTKAVLVVESEHDGFVYPSVAAGENPKVGDVLAWIFPTDDPSQIAVPAASEADTEGITVSAKAREAMKRHGITVEDFDRLTTIRATDVEALAQTRLTERSPKLIDELLLDCSSIVIYGTGSQAVTARDALDEGDQFHVVAHVDFESRTMELNGLPVFHASALGQLAKRGLKYVHISLPDTSRESLAERELQDNNLDLVSAIHPSAVISQSASIGKNIYVGPLAVIGPFAELEDYCRVLNSASVAHHSRIGRSTRVSDGARIGGHVAIGDRALVGLGATVNFHLSVGDDVVIVSGAHVYDSVPDNHVVRIDDVVPKRSGA